MPPTAAAEAVATKPRRDRSGATPAVFCNSECDFVSDFASDFASLGMCGTSLLQAAERSAGGSVDEEPSLNSKMQSLGFEACSLAGIRHLGGAFVPLSNT